MQSHFRIMFVSDSVPNGDEPFVRPTLYTREQVVTELRAGLTEQWYDSNSHQGYEEVIATARQHIDQFAAGTVNVLALPVPFGVLVAV